MSEGRAALLIAIALLVCGWSVFSSGLIDVELDSVQALIGFLQQICAAGIGASVLLLLVNILRGRK